MRCQGVGACAVHHRVGARATRTRYDKERSAKGRACKRWKVRGKYGEIRSGELWSGEAAYEGVDAQSALGVAATSRSRFSLWESLLRVYSVPGAARNQAHAAPQSSRMHTPSLSEGSRTFDIQYPVPAYLNCGEVEVCTPYSPKESRWGTRRRTPTQTARGLGMPMNGGTHTMTPPQER